MMDCDDNRVTAFHGGIPGYMFLIARSLRTALDRRMARYGLTFRQASLLIRCVHKPGAILNRHTHYMCTDNAGMSRLADRLESAGLVRRTEGGDRRSISLEPTPEGILLCPKLEKILHDAGRRLTAGFSPDEMVQAEELLQRILGNTRTFKNDIT